jgi:hypothetical protein
MHVVFSHRQGVTARNMKLKRSLGDMADLRL